MYAGFAFPEVRVRFLRPENEQQRRRCASMHVGSLLRQHSVAVHELSTFVAEADRAAREALEGPEAMLFVRMAVPEGPGAESLLIRFGAVAAHYEAALDGQCYT